MLRPILKTIFILTGLITSLIVAESILRFFAPQPTIDDVLALYDYNCYSTLPYYWVGLEKNSNCTFKSIDGSFKPFNVKVNSLGLRGNKVLPKQPNTKRVLFLGDSFTFGIGVKDADTFSNVVAKILNKTANEKFESLNAGVPAAEIGYDYLFLKNTGLSLKPDVVIVGFYPQNDITDTADQVWTKDKNGLPTKITSTYMKVNDGKLLPRQLPLKYSTPIVNHSQLYSLVTNLVPNQKYNESHEKAKTLNQLMTPSTCVYKSNCHELDKNKDDIKMAFLGLKQLTDKNSIKLYVVLIPAPFEVSPKYNLSRYNILIPLLPSELDYPDEYFMNFFKKNKIQFIDSKLTFKQNNRDLYLLNDGHLNATGHRILGSIISEKLTDSFKLSASVSATKL